MSKCALIMAGGTGGHVFPGLAVADTMKAAGWRVDCRRSEQVFSLTQMITIIICEVNGGMVRIISMSQIECVGFVESHSALQ